MPELSSAGGELQEGVKHKKDAKGLDAHYNAWSHRLPDKFDPEALRGKRATKWIVRGEGGQGGGEQDNTPGQE